jgi:hypothetical protein
MFLKEWWDLIAVYLRQFLVMKSKTYDNVMKKICKKYDTFVPVVLESQIRKWWILTFSDRTYVNNAIGETVMKCMRVRFCFPPAFTLVSCLVYSYEGDMFLVMQADLQRTTRPYIPEERNFHNHRYDTHKSHTIYIVDCKHFWKLRIK